MGRRKTVGESTRFQDLPVGLLPSCTNLSSHLSPGARGEGSNNNIHADALQATCMGLPHPTSGSSGASDTPVCSVGLDWKCEQMNQLIISVDAERER